MNRVHLKIGHWCLKQKACILVQTRNKAQLSRVNVRYERQAQVPPPPQSGPLSPGTCQHFGEGGQDNPCLGAETFEHQYFIAKTNYIAVYKSHQAVCSFIEVVQNTYGTASPSGGAGLLGDTCGRGGGRRGPARSQGGQELAGTEQREDPGVLVPKGRG